jgi:hypothetical protein
MPLTGGPFSQSGRERNATHAPYVTRSFWQNAGYPMKMSKLPRYTITHRKHT